MKVVARAYSSNRECSLQEVVHHYLPKLWIQKVFLGVTFANTDIPEKRFIVLRSQKDIGDSPDESKNIFKNICLMDMQIGQMKAFVMDVMM